MVEFLTSYLVFLLSHSLPTRPAARSWLVARLGERRFQLVYSLLSLAALAWLLTAARAAPSIALWPTAPWQVIVALLVMPVAFMLIGIGLLVANARSISLWPTPAGWQPSGVLRRVRHPLLIGLALWAAAHVLVNGDLVGLMLFGGLGLFALAGTRLIARRRARARHGAGEGGPERGAGGSDLGRQILAAAFGLGLFAVALGAHPLLFGVDPLAWL
ncbi:MAG: NnrU family protein [Geminicoccaceae bacterium]